jgi:hypothetical protein
MCRTHIDQSKKLQHDLVLLWLNNHKMKFWLGVISLYITKKIAEL